MKKMKFLIPAFALVALTFAGCSDDGDDQPVVTKLALADPAQAALTFVATSPEAQVIALDTDASTVTVEQVLAEGEEKAEWCVVTVQSATQIKVAPASNLTTEERTAKYRISAGTVTPVEFTVTQDFPEPVDATLSIDLEGEYGYFFTAPASGGEISVTTVTTNAHLWTAELDPGFGDEPIARSRPRRGPAATPDSHVPAQYAGHDAERRFRDDLGRQCGAYYDLPQSKRAYGDIGYGL